MRILLADDEFVSRKKLEKIMQSLGDCVVCTSGDEALSAFAAALERGEPFDLVSLDVSMPGMNGLELLAEMRRLECEHTPPSPRRAKAVMVTARNDRDTVLNSIRAGCDAYITKPFDRDRVVRRLRQLWETPSPA